MGLCTKSYEYYLQEPGRYFICLEDSGKIVGSFHISGIIRGWFQSAYLSYNVFSPYQRRGYMREGLQLVLEEAFGPLNLHRLEANVQPDNSASLRLIEQAGFINEGYSKAYLNIGGLGWKDHERWAILNPHWREQE